MLLNKFMLRQIAPHSSPRFTHAVRISCPKELVRFRRAVSVGYCSVASRWIMHVQYHQPISSQIGRVWKEQLQPKTDATILDSRMRSAAGTFSISCSARTHQFYLLQTRFVNVSSSTIITVQVFHKSSLIPIKNRAGFLKSCPGGPMLCRV